MYNDIIYGKQPNLKMESLTDYVIKLRVCVRDKFLCISAYVAKVTKLNTGVGCTICTVIVKAHRQNPPVQKKNRKSVFFCSILSLKSGHG